MEPLSSNNKSIKYLLCAIDVFTKYAWVKPLEETRNLCFCVTPQNQLFHGPVSVFLK